MLLHAALVLREAAAAIPLLLPMLSMLAVVLPVGVAIPMLLPMLVLVLVHVAFVQRAAA